MWISRFVLCIAALWFCSSLLAAKVNIDKEAEGLNHPGGIAEIHIPKTSALLPTVKYGLKEPAILENDSYWRVLIGISLEQLPGDYLVYIHEQEREDDDGISFKKFQVNHKTYPLRDGNKITVKKLKIFSQLSELDFSNSQPPTLPMQWPFNAQWDTGFGDIFLQGDETTPNIQNHTFGDATPLTLVKAPQTGIVCNIDQSKNGLYTVVIDHGRGIYSLLHNLDDITVELGNGVVAGAVLGKVAADNKPSTSSTQPELTKQREKMGKPVYWQVQLNGVFVNPVYLTQL